MKFHVCLVIILLNSGTQLRSAVLSTQRPHIILSSTTMTFISHAGAHAVQVMYWYMSDASEPNQTKPDHRWTHFTKFNKLDFLVEAMYNPPDIPNLPRYVSNHSFGIVSGQVRAVVSKVSENGKDYIF